MTDAELPDIDDAADNAIDGLFIDRGEVAHRWVLVADVTTQTGERVQYVLASPGSHLVDSIGLLGYADALQRGAAGREGE
ncbi:MAG TPA: hypothetical protein VM430_18850 [Microbacterium sp.]|nr:hypothetical protein [Microbacterium sp.]